MDKNSQVTMRIGLKNTFEVERAAGGAKPDCLPKVAAETSQGLHFPSLPQSTAKVIINDAHSNQDCENNGGDDQSTECFDFV